MQRLTVFAPGSTSNLGPGFDCLGVAVSGLGDRVTAERAAVPGVRVRSVSDPRIPLEAGRNTAAIAASAVLRALGTESGTGIELEVVKGLPLAGGLGGSAASAVAGAVAAARLLDAPLPSEALFTAALEAEAVVAGRHPDNVAPSLLGGAVVVLGLEPLRLARLVIHPSLRLVFVLPGYGVETAGARAALPPEVSRADAVGQAAALAGLVLGLERGDGALIRSCLVDRIAEPVRLPLYPGYPEARSAAIEAGALGVAVSGAGPTLLALALAKDAAGAGAAAVEAYRRVGIEAQTHVTSADAEGARVVA